MSAGDAQFVSQIALQARLDSPRVVTNRLIALGRRGVGEHVACRVRVQDGQRSDPSGIRDRLLAGVVRLPLGPPVAATSDALGHVGAKHGVDTRLIPRTLGFEPLQHVGIDAQRDRPLRRRLHNSGVVPEIVRQIR